MRHGLRLRNISLSKFSLIKSSSSRHTHKNFIEIYKLAQKTEQRLSIISICFENKQFKLYSLPR